MKSVAEAEHRDSSHDVQFAAKAVNERFTLAIAVSSSDIDTDQRLWIPQALVRGESRHSSSIDDSSRL